METAQTLRSALTVVLISLIACLPAHGLVSVNEGKNQLFVVGNLNIGWDSNIFASNGSDGDYIYAASVGLDFQRRAGLIGINASMYLDASQFGTYKDENFQNPRFRAEFTKQSGRTTGSLTLGAARQSRADASANLRSESWNYDAGLNIKYPVIERYSISGGLSYALLDYLDNSLLVDLQTYTANVDLFYVYSSERDLIAGYRLRYGETSASTSFYDHAFTAGISGKILPKVGGSLRVGYQLRQPNGSIEDNYHSTTAAIAATWNASKRSNLTVQAAKDFSVTSTNINIDATTLNLDLQYALNAKLSLYAGTGYGLNRFLGSAGAGREDTFFSWNAGVSYSFRGERLKAALTYAYFHNWSNVDFADFTRNTVNLNLSSRF